MLRSIEPMIWSILTGYNIPAQDKSDLKSEAMIHLWQKVIPRFDEDRGVKFSSFAYRCVVNFINKKLYTNARKNHLTDEMHSTFSFQEYISNDGALGQQLAHVDALIGDKASQLKPREIEVLTILRENPSMTQRDIAAKIGYRHPSSVSMLLKRLRIKIRRMNLFDN